MVIFIDDLNQYVPVYTYINQLKTHPLSKRYLSLSRGMSSLLIQTVILTNLTKNHFGKHSPVKLSQLFIHSNSKK